MQKILVVDDDSHIREMVCFALAKGGFATVEAAHGQAALELFARERPDLIVLDIMMPEMDGTEVCRRLRREATTPIIFLSSKDDEIDRIVGLELGGDDYVTKPFSPRELVARVRAVLRRDIRTAHGDGRGAPPRQLTHGKLILDLEAVTASWDGVPVVLTATEFAILRVLAGRPGKVFSREALMDSAYDDRRFVSDRTIDSHVRRLRSKLAAVGAAPIETVHGLGYKLAGDRR
jgi:two-component system, OmpR family, response regulator